MDRIERDKRTVARMIGFYCRRAEGNDGLCAPCRELLEYSLDRLDRCPYGNAKPACKRCTTHCYKPGMRERMRRVMRFAGPRMIFHAPAAAIRHLLGR